MGLNDKLEKKTGGRAGREAPIRYKASNICYLSFNLRMEKDCDLHREILSKVRGENDRSIKQHDVELEHYHSHESERLNMTVGVFSFSGILSSVDTELIDIIEPNEVLLRLNYYLCGPISINQSGKSRGMRPTPMKLIKEQLILL